MATNKVDVDNIVQKNLKVLEQNFRSTMETSLKNMEQRLQDNFLDRLAKLEKDTKDHIQNVVLHFEATMQAMEDSLKTSVKATEDNIVNLNNQLIAKVEHFQQQQIVHSKKYQKMSYNELKQISENRDILYVLTDSMRNISIQGQFNTQLLKFMHPVSSCRQALKLSGRYVLKVNSIPFEVVCEQNMFDGGWTVIQHRFNGSVDFYRNWTEYRDGFGSLDGEFWLGLEYVHQLTKNRPHELLVEIKDFLGNSGYARYDRFEIGNETEKYVLKKLGTYSGTAGDSMKNDKDEKFSTFDRDNDKDKRHCAEQRHGAWWYWHCTHSNLNGRYQNTTDTNSAMASYDFKNDWRGLSYSRIMIRDILN